MTQSINQYIDITQTNFSIQIDNILNKRRKFAEKVKVTKSNIDKLLKCLENLNIEQFNIMNGLKDKPTRLKLKNVNFQNLIKKLRKEQSQLAKLQSRFSRDTLNIAVFGMAGQGKSRLLQTLTGLNENIIPSGKSGDCTAVLSRISHLSGSNKDKKTNIIVKFHYEDSFLEEVIIPYYKVLKLEPIPKNISDFVEKPLPQLLDKNEQVKKTKYSHLENFHTKLKDDFKKNNTDVLLDGSTKYINESELRNYVTQDSEDNLKYLGVKEINIECSFPKSEEMGIQKLSFVDMPGFGDGKSHNLENSLREIGEEIDFVLLMVMPDFNGRINHEINDQLYSLIDKNAIPNLSLKEWSFYVANYYPSSDKDNKSACESFCQTYMGKNIVANVVMANCADEKEVTSNILNPILQHLATNLENLDRQYAKNCQEELKSVQSNIEIELNKASVYNQESTTSNFGNLTTKYTDWFNIFFDSLGNQLNDLVNEMTAKAKQAVNNNNDDNFRNIINHKIEEWNNKSFLPNSKKINEKIMEFGKDQHPSAAITSLLNIIKSDITNPFNNINSLLAESLEVSQIRIADVLVKSGNLKIINPGNSRFFEDFEQKIPQELDIQHLKAAIIFVKEYNVTYEAIITKIITVQSEKYLKYTPDFWDLEPGITNKRRNNPENYIISVLTKKCQKVIDGSREEIRKLSLNPPQEFASMIRQFRDKAFQNPQVRDDWRKFLSYYIAEILPDEFDSNTEDIKLKQEWMQIVKDAEQANSSDALSFLL
ncbi:dynamin family protein [Pleurocapsa sp. FMAR1]|uniref:dynamin family protein n=1 Tax=Pleurocapsa sp. FMAR1 TaxID=3040204 RepID=UPI0029C93B08|nr:dynamin family protein [Pleurocapsa sp. FMAR1]